MLQGSIFNQDKPQIHLGEDVASAVIMGNTFRGGPKITNESSGDVQVLGNVTLP